MAFVPENREYTIRGRVYDKTTSQFLEGVEVQSLLGGETIKTDNQGRFELTLNLETNPENGKIVQPARLLYTKGGFIPSYQSILTGNDRVKSDLRNASLLNIETAAEQEINKITTRINDKIDDVRNLLGPNAGLQKQKAIMRIVRIIQTKLIPLILGMIVSFGITNLQQRQQMSCPGGDTLRTTVRRRNRIAKQLNNIFAQIAANTALAAVFAALEATYLSTAQALINTPVPVSTPPGVGLPMSVINRINDIIDNLQDKAEESQGSNRKVLVALVYLATAISIVVNLLRGLDSMTQECAEKAGIDFDQVELDEELLELATQQQNENTGFTNTEVNGFNLSVEVDDQEIGSLKRRFAVARDASGVAVLTGEKSLGSSDQILIDELAYYIRINDLKAV